MSKFFIISLLLFASNSCFGQHKKEQIKKVDKTLSKAVERNKTPSVQYIVFNQDSVAYRKQVGYSDIENKVVVDKSTTFNAFSITKTFTALAILQLAEKGKINIEHSASKYLPNFPYSKEITVKQLLTHSAGIPNPIPLNWIHLKKEHRKFDRNRFFEPIFQKNHKIKSQPNEKFAYSNLGYVLLGQIIENVSKVSYERYVKTNILEKLGIENELNFEIDTSTHAKGYHKKWSFSNFILGFLIDKSKFMKKSKGKWKPFKEFYVNGSSYGGLIGTPDALMIYLQSLLKPNSVLISDEYKALLFKENRTENSKSTKMCLSWFKGELNGNEYFAHAGGGGGFYSEIRIYPKLGIGSVIMFNRTGMKDERFLDKLDKYYIEKK